MRLAAFSLRTFLWIVLLVGATQLVIALKERHFLRTADPENLAICTQNAHMDCDPRAWGARLLFGLSLIFAARSRKAIVAGAL